MQGESAHNQTYITSDGNKMITNDKNNSIIFVIQPQNKNITQQS